MRRLLIPALALLLLAPVACDDDDNVTVTVPDFTPPSVAILAPAGGDIVHGVVELTVMAADPSGVDRVELWVDGANAGVVDDAEPFVLAWDTAGLGDHSTHVVTARAYDGAGVAGDGRPLNLVVYQSPDLPFLLDLLATNDLQLTIRELMDYACTFQVRDGVERLVSFNLGANAGTRIRHLPSSIGLLDALNYLTLANGSFDALPAEFGNLSSLIYLRLASLAGLVEFPPEFGNLTALEEIHFSQLINFVGFPGSISGLTSLRAMRLETCRAFAVNAALCSLPALERLELLNCDLIDLPPEIGQMSSLRELDLWDNQLTDLPAEFADLTGLIELDLSGNEFGTAPASLDGLSSLEFLDLERTQLTAFPSALLTLPSLQHLRLGSNYLATLPPDFCDLVAGMGITADNWATGYGTPRIDLRGNQLFCDGGAVDPDLLPTCLREALELGQASGWKPSFMYQSCSY